MSDASLCVSRRVARIALDRWLGTAFGAQCVEAANMGSEVESIL